MWFPKMVIKKEDIYEWFKDCEPHTRLQTLCCLLNMCLPFELHFLKTCLMDLTKRADLRDIEAKMNNRLEIENIVNCTEDDRRSKVVISVALLDGCNHTGSQILHNYISSESLIPADKRRNKDALREVLLICVMVLNHPAFIFHQKKSAIDLLAEIELEHQEPNEEIQCNNTIDSNAGTYEENIEQVQSHLCCQDENTLQLQYCDSNENPLMMTPNPVYNTVYHPSNINPILEPHMQSAPLGSQFSPPQALLIEGYGVSPYYEHSGYALHTTPEIQPPCLPTKQPELEEENVSVDDALPMSTTYIYNSNLLPQTNLQQEQRSIDCGCSHSEDIFPKTNLPNVFERPLPELSEPNASDATALSSQPTDTTNKLIKDPIIIPPPSELKATCSCSRNPDEKLSSSNKVDKKSCSEELFNGIEERLSNSQTIDLPNSKCCAKTSNDSSTSSSALKTSKTLSESSSVGFCDNLLDSRKINTADNNLMSSNHPNSKALKNSRRQMLKHGTSVKTSESSSHNNTAKPYNPRNNASTHLSIKEKLHKLYHIQLANFSLSQLQEMSDSSLIELGVKPNSLSKLRVLLMEYEREKTAFSSSKPIKPLNGVSIIQKHHNESKINKESDLKCDSDSKTTLKKASPKSDQNGCNRNKDSPKIIDTKFPTTESSLLNGSSSISFGDVNINALNEEYNLTAAGVQSTYLQTSILSSAPPVYSSNSLSNKYSSNCDVTPTTHSVTVTRTVTSVLPSYATSNHVIDSSSDRNNNPSDENVLPFNGPSLQTDLPIMCTSSPQQVLDKRNNNKNCRVIEPPLPTNCQSPLPVEGCPATHDSTLPVTHDSTLPASHDSLQSVPMTSSGYFKVEHTNTYSLPNSAPLLGNHPPYPYNLINHMNMMPYFLPGGGNQTGGYYNRPPPLLMGSSQAYPPPPNGSRGNVHGAGSGSSSNSSTCSSTRDDRRHKHWQHRGHARHNYNKHHHSSHALSNNNQMKQSEQSTDTSPDSSQFSSPPQTPSPPTANGVKNGGKKDDCFPQSDRSNTSLAVPPNRPPRLLPSFPPLNMLPYSPNPYFRYNTPQRFTSSRETSPPTHSIQDSHPMDVPPPHYYPSYLPPQPPSYIPQSSSFYHGSSAPPPTDCFYPQLPPHHYLPPPNLMKKPSPCHNCGQFGHRGEHCREGNHHGKNPATDT